mgnify:CR=1 FL=1
MKNNKLLVVIILLGFLSFGMKYNSIIKKNVVAPIVESLAKAEITFINQKEEKNKSKKPEIKKIQKTTSAVAATVTVTNAVAVNGGGNAQPGSQLDYTITIANTGADDALGTTFQDILDSNLTLVPNSFKATPIGNNDSYSCIGNVGITVNAAQGVLVNDISPDGTTLTAGVLTNPTNGTVNLASNGSFTYNSNAGYSGADSFTYTVTTGSGKTSTATVNITVTTPIIFVNGAAATAGNGTLATPYKALSSITGTSANPIFIYSGTALGTLNLNNDQKVIGQGAALSLVSILSLTVPSYSNTLPSTAGTNPIIAGINLKANNDIQAVAMTGTLSGSAVGNLKIKNATISVTNGQAVSIGNASTASTIDCVFQSISCNNAVKGISVTNAAGNFQITGTGTTAGSGGTILNIQDRGVEFISCANISLKNMNFTNANSSTSIASNPEDDNSSSFGAMFFKSISGGVTLDNIAITGTTNSMGINLNNVTNFALSNSTLTGCGSYNGGNVNVGGIFALNLKGTCSITNTNVNDSWGRGFFGFNGLLSQNPNLSLAVTGCQFKNSFNKSNGDSNFIFQAKGSTINNLVFKKNDFSNSKSTGLALNFYGTSSNTVQIGGNNAATDANTINAATSSPGSSGLSLQVNESATVNYNIINNTIKSSYNALYTCNVGNQGSGTVKGRINNNIIDAGGVSSSTTAITVSAYGSAKHITEIIGNTITNAGTYGISSEANDNNIVSTARIDATIKNNNISLINGGYAHIAIVSYADNNASNMISAANITGNITNAPTGLIAGTFDVVSQGTNSQVILQGTAAFVPGTNFTNNSVQLKTFWDANNSTGTALHEPPYTGKIVSGTVTAPDNASASKMAPTQTVPTEETAPTVETVAANLQNNNSVTAKSASAAATATTLSAGPFTLPAGKSTVITFSATINAAVTLPQNTCSVTNQATVSGSNFATVNSNITTTSIKPANATVTTDTQNITCLGSTAVTLNAVCPLNTTATWYTAMTGGTSFANGASVSATPTANNTTYCVACETAYCASDRVLVKTVTGTPSTASPPENVVACDTYKWSVNGTTYTSSGTYTSTVGCDTKTLNLTITPSTTSAPENVVACDTYKWSVNGVTYNSSGTYTATVGCDTKTLNLTITPSTSSPVETISRCDSYTWPVNGQTYTASGTYTDKIGCDTKTLALTITNTTNSTQTESVCDSYTWPVNGETYTTSGTYTKTVGCDTKTLVLTITNTTSSTQTESVCDSYTWPVNGVTYTTSGTYTKTIGCDTKTLVLTVTNATNSTQTESVCDSYTWPVNGETYTTSGTYTKTVGCDTKTLVLTVTNTTSSTQTESVCDSYTWPVNGLTYTTSGTYTNTVGCDTKTLVLTITNATNSTQTESVCDSYTWPVNGLTYTTSGTYTNTVGCDTKTLVLTITNATNSTQTELACDSYTWPVNGVTYTNSGTYTYSAGCDTKTLQLTINNSSAILKSVSLNSGILTSDHAGAVYQWYKCPNTLLANENNQSFTPSVVGEYKVEITVAGCTIVSDCINVSTLGVDDFKSAEFRMYPIPSKGILNIVTKYNGNYIIIDASGKIVKSVNLDSDILNTIHIENLSDGVYLIKNSNHNTFKAQKFILKK